MGPLLLTLTFLLAAASDALPLQMPRDTLSPSRLLWSHHPGQSFNDRNQLSASLPGQTERKDVQGYLQFLTHLIRDMDQNMEAENSDTGVKLDGKLNTMKVLQKRVFQDW